MWVRKWNDVQTEEGSLLDSLIPTGGMTVTLLHFPGLLCICVPMRGLPTRSISITWVLAESRPHPN